MLCIPKKGDLETDAVVEERLQAVMVIDFDDWGFDESTEEHQT